MMSLAELRQQEESRRFERLRRMMPGRPLLAPTPKGSPLHSAAGLTVRSDSTMAAAPFMRPTARITGRCRSAW